MNQPTSNTPETPVEAALDLALTTLQSLADGLIDPADALSILRDINRRIGGRS